MECVSWDDVQTYIQWLNTKTGKTYRLPSEAEWEYAARAGTKTKYWWGDKASHKYANYGSSCACAINAESCCGGLVSGRDQWVYTGPVASFPANAFGLHDMHGNVSEWVADVYHDNYKGAPSDGSVWAGFSDLRVVCGGSWDSRPQYMQVSFRSRYSQDHQYEGLGFRLAFAL